MDAKTKEKEKAILLRKQGKTYSEILHEVTVSKSTLSLWLRNVGLAKRQKQKLTAKKRAAQARGAKRRNLMRRIDTLTIYKNATKEIGNVTRRELLLIGTALYWAEGSKEKKGRLGQGVDFGNTDPAMINIFLCYLREVLGVDSDQIKFSLYIHQNHKYRLNEVLRFWNTTLLHSKFEISYVYFKKHNPKTIRKKTDNAYYGTLRVYVRKSSSIQRRIQGWIYGITGEHCRVV